MNAKLWDDSCSSHLVIVVGHVKLDLQDSEAETRELSVSFSVASSTERRSASTAARRCLVRPDTAIWNEVISFELPPRYAKTALGDDPTEYPVLTMEVRAKKLVGWQTIGYATLDTRQLDLDNFVVLDNRLNEYGSKEKKKKGQRQGRTGVGSLIYAAYVTQKRMFPERSSSLTAAVGITYPFDNDMNNIRPGDIVLYNKSGPYSTIYHTAFGTFFTHCGIVVPMEDDATGIEQVCVFEYGCNFEGSMSLLLPSADSIPQGAPGLFPLKQRLRQFLGAEAWLLPLKKPFTDKEVEKLVKWAKQMVVNFAGRKKELLRRKEFSLFPFTKSQESFLAKFGLKTTDRTYFADYYSANFVVLALQAIGCEISYPGTIATINDLVYSGLYNMPLLLKARTEYAKNLFWPNDPPKKDSSDDSDDDSDEDSDDADGYDTTDDESKGESAPSGKESVSDKEDKSKGDKSKGDKSKKDKDKEKKDKKEKPKKQKKKDEKKDSKRSTGEQEVIKEVPRVSVGYIGESDSDESIDMDEYENDDSQTVANAFTLGDVRKTATLKVSREGSMVIPRGMMLSDKNAAGPDSEEEEEEEKEKAAASGGNDDDDDDDDINDADYM